LAGAPLEASAPLQDWDSFEKYVPPDPLQYDLYGDPIDWDKRKQDVERVKSEGGLATGGLVHGAMYMHLYYLRGFNNFMMGVGTKEPRG
jgi:hypothetical protein